VAIALGAFVYFYEIGGEEERRTAELEAQRLFPDFEEGDVTVVTLVTSDGESVRAERRDERWQLISPFAFPADGAAFDSMAASLAQISGETAIVDPQEPSVYGLDADEREVRFVAGGSEHVLRIGDKTPVGANSYVARGGEAGVYTVPSHRVNPFARSLADLRDKRILDFDREAVDRIEASWPDGRVVLERADAGWVLREPLDAPADEAAVRNLLSDLSYLRADGFRDEPVDDAVSGLARPAFAVRLTGSVPGATEGSFERTLAVGGVTADDTRLVRGAESALYEIGADRLEDFPREETAYREKQLADFAPLDAQRIDLLFHTAEQASVAIQAHRGEDGWTSEPERFASGKLAALSGALSNLRAVDIAAESFGPDELRGAGLDPANAIYRVFGEAVEGAEGEEPPLLAEVRLGALRGSEGVLAQRAGDDVVYVLDYQVAEQLPVSWEAFENRFRAAPEPPAAGEVAPAAAPDAGE